MNDKNQKGPKKKNGRSLSRSAAIRAQQRNQGDAQRVIDQYDLAADSAPNKNNQPKRANQLDDSPRLKIIALRKI
jgi:hypothetical protein